MSRNPKDIVPLFLQNPENGKILSDKELNETAFILESASAYAYPKVKTDRQWAVFIQTSSNNLTVVKRPKYAMFRWVAAAVLVCTVALASWQYYSYKASTFSGQFASGKEKKEIKLPDGSTINMNRESELEVRAINNSKRIVELKNGDVFVSVLHNNTPFTFICPKGRIYVLGTEFHVSARKGKPLSVFLKKGRIRYEILNVSGELTPGQIIQEDSQGDLCLSSENGDNSYSWLSGKLSFRNTSLAEIIKGLQEHYKVEYDYDRKLDLEKLTISFDNLDAHQAASLLSRTLKSKISVK